MAGIVRKSVKVMCWEFSGPDGYPAYHGSPCGEIMARSAFEAHRAEAHPHHVGPPNRRLICPWDGRPAASGAYQPATKSMVHSCEPGFENPKHIFG